MSSIFLPEYFQTPKARLVCFKKAMLGPFLAALMAVGPASSYAARNLAQGHATVRPAQGTAYTQHWVTYELHPAQTVQGIGPNLAAEHLVTPLAGGAVATESASSADAFALQDLRQVEGLGGIAEAGSSQAGKFDERAAVRSDAFLDGEGSVPAELRSPLHVAGKTLLVVGTKKDRPVMEWVMDAARKLGLNIALLDDPEHRVNSPMIPERRFIPGPVLEGSPEAMDEIARRVAQFHAHTPIDGAYTALNPYAELTGFLTDLLGTPGNSRQTVQIAHTKHLARAQLARDYAELTVPTYEVRTEADVRPAFQELSQGGKYRVVLKPSLGGGSTLVRVGIASESEAVNQFLIIQRSLAANAQDRWHMFNRDPGILMERYVPGPEVDYETVLQHGQEKFGLVIGNIPAPPPFATELGSTYPSQLPPHMQEKLRWANGKAMRALRLKYGNVHTEMIYGPDGPVIVEVNVRVGGDIIPTLIRMITGHDVIEKGIRSIFNLPVTGLEGPLPVVLEERYVVPKVAGTLLSMEWPRSLESIPVFRPFMDKIGKPVTQEDWLAHLAIVGKTYDQTIGWMLEALSLVTVKILTEDGAVVTQNGADGHSRQVYTGF